VLRDQGIDPIEARRADHANAALEAARVMTLDQCRDAFIAAKQAGWRNVKHAGQWRNTLATYVSPVFGKVSLGAVDTAPVLFAHNKNRFSPVELISAASFRRGW
jgi:hypothetical protein